LFRGHVGNGADCRAGTSEMFLGYGHGRKLRDADPLRDEANGRSEFRQPEVQDFRVTMACHKDICWLDIAVDDTFRVSGI